MSFLTFPAYPPPSSVDIRLISRTNELTSAFGGPTQRINRTGSRFAIDVTLPPMNGETARPWLAALAAASSATPARMAFPQGRAVIPATATTEGPTPGVKVNGAGQAGSTLIVDGLIPGVSLPAGHALSVITAGVPYLYLLTAPFTANGSGQATLAIGPMLRRSPADNDEVLLEEPIIEGWAFSGGGRWSIDAAAHFGLQFTLAERQ